MFSFTKFKTIKIHFFLIYLLLNSTLICKNSAWALPNDISTEQTEALEDANLNTFKAIINSMITAYIEEDYEAVIRLFSEDSQKQFMSALITFASLRALDPDYKEETAALKAEIAEIGQSDSPPSFLEADVTKRALYIQTMLDSLKPVFPKLDLSKKYQDMNSLKYKLEILSLKNNTAVIGLTAGELKGVYKFIEQKGQWLLATQEEIEFARIPEGSIHYVAPGLLPLPETIPYLSVIPPIESTADWYQTLPPTTAKEKGIEVGDAVVGYIKAGKFGAGFYNFRVISLEKTSNGERATIIRQDKKVFSNIPLSVLYTVENYTNRSQPLQTGDVALLNEWGNTTLVKISRIEDSQIYIKYVRDDWTEEKLLEGIIIPLPKDGYVLRKVLFRQDDDLKTGIVLAENDSQVWIKVTHRRGLTIINKADTQLINLSDSNLRLAKVWTLERGDKKQVQIIRVIEPGLLYEINEQNYKGEYRLLSFDEILLSEPSIE